MALIQMVAAWLADVDLVYHTFDATGTRGYLAGEKTLKEIVAANPNGLPVEDLIALIESKHYQWGVSDGN
jgi:hypothetical protein